MMNVELVHPFKDILPDVDELFVLVNGGGVIGTVNSFCDRLKTLADKHQAHIDAEDFKGGALELFAEYLIKSGETDNRIGIYNYVPVAATDDMDYGVDGFGIGENQNPATVQVKFRSGDYVLTANGDNLTNFLFWSQNKYAVKIEDTKNMLLITTGLKLDDRIKDEMFMGKVRVLNREALREMLDNRPEWWTRFYEAVKSSRTKQEPKQAPISLRQHQTEAVHAVLADTNKKGKVVLPTGTGKTLIESEIIRSVILDKMAKGAVPIIKVNSPRILLCFQLFEEIFNYLSSHGIAAKFVNFNSGKSDDRYYMAEIRKQGGIFRQIVSTTSPSEVVAAYASAVKENLPMIVFSTYHSSEKFAESGLVPHATIHDEAHNLVSKEFSLAAVLPSEMSIFFTATEKITDSNDDLGMNNPEIFDEMIYTKSPVEMIDKGEMIAPRMHIVRAKSGVKVNLDHLERDHDAIFTSIADAFFAHQKQIHETSYDANQIGAKVLVVCRGQQDLIGMFNSHLLTRFRTEYPDIHIFALSSDFGLFNDGEFYAAPVTHGKKFSFLKKVKALKSNEKAIIFHVDMIGEGIDIPGITGVMPFRNCDLSKFVQNIGRASRLHPTDRKKVYAGEIAPKSPKGWVKPYSWVIVPNFLENADGFLGRFRQIVGELRTKYGYIPQQHTVIDNVKGLDDDDPIDTVNAKVKRRGGSKTGLKDFEHEFEQMSALEKILFDDGVYKAYEDFSKDLDNLIGNI